MQIYSIEMKNFRCFFGTQRIDFSTDAEKNITLIHAQNGVGKTTLLNSILWCFYEKVSKGFEKPNNIINEEALKKTNLLLLLFKYLLNTKENNMMFSEVFDLIHEHQI